MRDGNGYGSAGMGFMDGEFMPVSEMRIPVTDMDFSLATCAMMQSTCTRVAFSA